MKAFEFNIDGFEIKRDGNTLFIHELDYDGGRMGHIEISHSDLNIIMEISERLQAHNNPTCSEVTAARTKLENARDKRNGGGKGGDTSDVFDSALEAYTDVLMRHRESSSCVVFH